MDDLIEIRNAENCSCVIRTSTKEVYTFHRRGVADLYELWSKRPQILQGAEIVDKVVGKGAAALMIQGGVTRLHAHVISQSAMELFSQSSVVVEAEAVVPHIINRKQSDWCPLEKLCFSLKRVEDCLKAIDIFIKEQKLLQQ